jgi:two-component system CheB/CheR fusion protein
MAKKKKRAATARAASARRRAPQSGRGGPTQSLERTPVAKTVVAIGASAGGLEALRQLLQHLPGTTGLAYVVVQHLAPRHESALPELLSASSAIPVVQATEGMPLRPNRVHVIPPNTVMTMRNGQLHLDERPTGRTAYSPIDAFFSSLAAAVEERAVAVVLSGSASDGSNGLKDIKAVGGITIAQDPKTAKYDSMPRAAIATGAVDLVLSPDQIAEELARVGTHPFVAETSAAKDVAQGNFTEQQFEPLFGLLRSASGVDFSHYKLPTIKRRLQRRMMLHKTTRLDEYVKVLEKDPDEIKNLYRDILIHVTRFFREPASFDALKKTVFPRLVEEAAGRRPLRIWVPGCATGEEAYSIAISLLEFLGVEANTIPIQVFATDVSEEAVERARAGTYPESIAADVSTERLRRFFTRVDGHYRISKAVRDSCIFARQDLTRDPPFSKLDLVVCRNVLIYLGPRLQRKLMSVFHYALKPGGYLVLGSSESVGTFGEAFAVVDKRNKFYSRRAGQLRATFDFAKAGEEAFERELPPYQAMPVRPHGHATDLQNEVSRTLLGRYSPPGVVVDSDLQIVQTRGRTGPYLELASGEPSLNLLKMAREGLLHGLRSALHESRKTLKPVRRPGLIVRVNGFTREIDLQVLPVGGNETRHFIVLFETAQRPRAPKPTRARTNARIKDDRLEHMRQELTSSRDYMQTIIQDLEAANEELQSANEEILSSNEELQSTNEELDTAKEELQSTNEELNTVNEELNARNEELSHVNADLMNLLSAVPAAIVIVASDLRIRRFTPMAEQVLNLIPTDVGRPLGDIRPNIDAPDLEELTREVIDTVTIKELEALDRTGHRYSVRIRPYKDQENRIDGAVLAFADTHEARRRSAPLNQQILTSLINCVTHRVMILNEQFKVLAVNDAALAALGARSRQEVEGQELLALPKQWNGSALGQALERLRDGGQAFSNLPVEDPGGEKGGLQIDGRRLIGNASMLPMIVLTMRDAASPR